MRTKVTAPSTIAIDPMAAMNDEVDRVKRERLELHWSAYREWVEKISLDMDNDSIRKYGAEASDYLEISELARRHDVSEMKRCHYFEARLIDFNAKLAELRETEDEARAEMQAAEQALKDARAAFRSAELAISDLEADARNLRNLKANNPRLFSLDVKSLDRAALRRHHHSIGTPA